MVDSHKKNLIYTIGHSTHTMTAFIEILQHYKITHLIDIRTIPKSRHNPQFNEKSFHEALAKVKIHYTHLKKLGGLRHTTAASLNTGWENKSFRGFADYMHTPEFKEGLEQLIAYAQKETVVICCAEAVPWRCHRSLIGDALLVHGFIVEDIFSLTSLKPHTMTPWAKVEDGNITYPAP
jgi:uncharacterized protein (DUF488 family)